MIHFTQCILVCLTSCLWGRAPRVPPVPGNFPVELAPLGPPYSFVVRRENSGRKRPISGVFPVFSLLLPGAGSGQAFFARPNSAGKRPAVAFCRDLSAESV